MHVIVACIRDLQLYHNAPRGDWHLAPFLCVRNASKHRRYSRVLQFSLLALPIARAMVAPLYIISKLLLNFHFRLLMGWKRCQIHNRLSKNIICLAPSIKRRSCQVPIIHFPSPAEVREVIDVIKLQLRFEK